MADWSEIEPLASDIGIEYLLLKPIHCDDSKCFMEDEQSCYEAGINGHIAKPLNITQMIEIMNNAFKGNKDKLYIKIN